MQLTETRSYKKNYYGQTKAHAFFTHNGAKYELCHFTRADGVSLGLEIYKQDDGIMMQIGYVNADLAARDPEIYCAATDAWDQANLRPLAW